MAVTTIVTRVQWLLQDAGGSWTDTDYIYNALAIVNDDIEQELQNLGLNFDTQVIILPAVAAGTTDLSAYQADQQLLAGLVMPKLIEWRLVGQGQEDWQKVEQVDKVIDTDEGTGENNAAVAADEEGVESWEWRNGTIYLSPSSVAVDLRVRFQGLPTLIDSDSPFQPFRGLVNPLAYAVCEWIEDNRVGGNSASAMKFQKKKLRALGTFRATQVQGTHAKVERLGGRRSQGYGSGSWRPPIVG